MCGIVGIHGPQEDSWIERMNAIQAHRGPDDSGLFRDRDAGLALAMRRLAIIDLADGRQPMSTADGRFTIVFNGEIYNAPELRREMEGRGVAFATDHSDTEVVLNLYAERGADCLAPLNGMFAFALYDRDRRTLFCARDRVGIKPFYYWQGGGRFAFASELKSLLTLPVVERSVDPQSLFHYMSLMFVPGERTILGGVRRLPPGHSLSYRFDTGDLRIERWWRLTIDPQTGIGEAAWRERVRNALAAAARRWTLADVPVGCLLSGGLDSSAVVGLLARDGMTVNTYSLGFAGPGEEAWSELPLARAVADRWGARHREIVLDPETLLDDLPAMAWHMDEPYGGGLPSWSVFKHMDGDVKVALTGTGGDELFGNYFKFTPFESRLWPSRLYARGPVERQRFHRQFHDTHYYCPDAAKRTRVFAAGIDAPINTGDLLFDHFSAMADPTVRDRTTRTDFETQLPEEFLAMTDRFSMAHSIEARTPFLDHELIETVMRIPAAQRLHRRRYKQLLKRAIADLLPAPLLDAQKKGFVIPLKLWLRGRLRPVAERLLAPERLRTQGIFNPSFFDWAVRPHLEGTADNTTLVWGALMFQIWHAVFMESDAGARPSWDAKALAA